MSLFTVVANWIANTLYSLKHCKYQFKKYDASELLNATL